MKIGFRSRAAAITEQLGPGLATGAADVDPSGIATYALGISQIDSAAQAASALEPVERKFAFHRLSLGIIGTGMLAVSVLAGSAAYAFGEARGWPAGLDWKPWEAPGFYAVIGTATLLGIVIGWSPLDPINALFWSAVIDGVVAVPIMLVMMIVVNRRSRMGKFTASPLVTALGRDCHHGHGGGGDGCFMTGLAAKAGAAPRNFQRAFYFVQLCNDSRSSRTHETYTRSDQTSETIAWRT